MTVVGPELAWADAFALTAFALGPDAGLPWLAALSGYEGLAVLGDRRLAHTPGWVTAP